MSWLDPIIRAGIEAQWQQRITEYDEITDCLHTYQVDRTAKTSLETRIVFHYDELGILVGTTLHNYSKVRDGTG